MTVVPGAFNNRLEEGFQTAKTIDLLRRCAEVLEPHGLDHGSRTAQLVEATTRGSTSARRTRLTRSVAASTAPSCKILFDIYHQQIQEGNLIPNIDMAWDEIAYFQAGDNPGRKEPGTGEINYRNVFKHIHAKGFDGIVGMEHGKSLRGVEGDQALIDAYRAVDDF